MRRGGLGIGSLKSMYLLSDLESSLAVGLGCSVVSTLSIEHR